MTDYVYNLYQNLLTDYELRNDGQDSSLPYNQFGTVVTNRLFTPDHVEHCQDKQHDEHRKGADVGNRAIAQCTPIITLGLDHHGAQLILHRHRASIAGTHETPQVGIGVYAKCLARHLTLLLGSGSWSQQSHTRKKGNDDGESGKNSAVHFKTSLASQINNRSATENGL